MTPNNVRDLLQTSTYVDLKNIIARFVEVFLRLRVAQLLLCGMFERCASVSKYRVRASVTRAGAAIVLSVLLAIGNTPR